MTSHLTHLTDYLKEHAATRPEATAITSADRSFTWQQLSDAVAQAAAQLATELRTDEPQTIGILLPNSWEFAVAYLAILHLGHRALAYDDTFKKLQLEAIAERVQPVLTITDDRLRRELAAGAVYITMDTLLAPHTRTVAPKLIRQPAREQVATLLFTSGTTGVPKLSAYTHFGHLWNILTIGKLWGWSATDRLYLALPLSHWHGLVLGLEGSIVFGTTVQLADRLEPEAVFTALERGDITMFMHVPLGYSRLLEYEPTRKFDLGKVRLMVSGSSFLPPSLWEAFYHRFNQPILERYGASETGMLASNRIDDRQPGSVGRLLPGVEARVGEGGELEITSPGLFPGYFENEAATQKNLTADGWWRTGDIGEFDAAGHLWLKGRIQERMKKSGYLIYPRDIEWSMSKDPRVSDIVVIGLQDPGNLSDRIAYVVVATASEEELRAYAEANLPRSWRPDLILMLDEIPKTSSGKPKLAELKRRLADM